MEKEQNNNKKAEVKEPQPIIRLNTKQNFLKYYPESIRKYQQDKFELNLIQCQLEVSLMKLMPINQLHSISILNLQGNGIRDSGFTVLTQIDLPSLTCLIMGGNGLESIKGIGKFNKLYGLYMLDNDYEVWSNMLNDNAAKQLIQTKWQGLHYLSLQFKSPNPDSEGDFFDAPSVQNGNAWKIFISNNFQAFPKLQGLNLKKKNIGYTSFKTLNQANLKFTNSRIKIDEQDW